MKVAWIQWVRLMMRQKAPGRRNAVKETQGDRPWLLLVDSDPLLQWSLRVHLASSRHVVCASTFEIAQQAIATHRFDTLMVSLEDERSREIVRAAVARNSNVRVIYLTTQAAPRLTDPAGLWLEKPFRLDKLTSLLERNKA